MIDRQHSAAQDRRPLDDLADLFFSEPPARRPPPSQAARRPAPPSVEPTVATVEPTAVTVDPTVAPTAATPDPGAPDITLPASAPAFVFAPNFITEPDAAAAVAASDGPTNQWSLRPGVHELLADRPADPQAAGDCELAAADELDEPPVLAVLTAGLPPERREALTRAALGHLAGPPCAALVLTFAGRAVAVEVVNAPTVLSVSDGPGGRLEVRHLSAELPDLAAECDKVIVVLAEGVAEYLAAGRRLPQRCLVLALADGESLVESYRELKLAAASSAGPVPQLLVLGTGGHREAERVYRRLAGVAISHLGCTPCFAGHCVAPGQPAPQLAARWFDADEVYRRLRPLIAAAADDEDCEGNKSATIRDDGEDHNAYETRDDGTPSPLGACDEQPADEEPAPEPATSAPCVELRPAPTSCSVCGTAAPLAGVIVPETAPPVLPAKATTAMPTAATPTTSTVTPTIAAPTTATIPAAGSAAVAPDSTLSSNLPPPPAMALFTNWQPAARATLLAATREALAGLLPQARSVLDLAALSGAAGRPDFVTVDAAGQATAVAVADGSDQGDAADRGPAADQADVAGSGGARLEAAILRRAVLSRRWVSDYAALLTMAYPQAGLAAAAAVATMAIVPEESAEELAKICPPGVTLVGYRGVACGAARGLLLRPVCAARELPPMITAQPATISQPTMTAPPETARPPAVETKAEPVAAAATVAATVAPTVDQTADQMAAPLAAPPMPSPTLAAAAPTVAVPDEPAVASSPVNGAVFGRASVRRGGYDSRGRWPEAEELDDSLAVLAQQSPDQGTSPDDDLSADELSLLQAEREKEEFSRDFVNRGRELGR